jgi:hypothetical protein
MRVSEPSMKKDSAMRSVAVGDTVHVDVLSWSACGGIMRRYRRSLEQAGIALVKNDRPNGSATYLTR